MSQKQMRIGMSLRGHGYHLAAATLTVPGKAMWPVFVRGLPVGA